MRRWGVRRRWSCTTTRKGCRGGRVIRRRCARRRGITGASNTRKKSNRSGVPEGREATTGSGWVSRGKSKRSVRREWRGNSWKRTFRGGGRWRPCTRTRGTRTCIFTSRREIGTARNTNSDTGHIGSLTSAGRRFMGVNSVSKKRSSTGRRRPKKESGGRRSGRRKLRVRKCRIRR